MINKSKPIFYSQSLMDALAELRRMGADQGGAWEGRVGEVLVAEALDKSCVLNEAGVYKLTQRGMNVSRMCVRYERGLPEHEQQFWFFALLFAMFFGLVFSAPLYQAGHPGWGLVALFSIILPVAMVAVRNIFNDVPRRIVETSHIPVDQ